MYAYAAVEERSDLITIEPSILRVAQPELRPRSSEPSPLVNQRNSQARGSNLAKFWELRGRRVFQVDGVVWGEYKGSFFSSLPFHTQLDLEPEEINSILRKHSVRGLRFPSANQPGLASGIYVCRPADYSLQSVSRKQRGHVTQGLDTFQFRDVDPDELLREGMTLNRDTLQRQSRADDTFLDARKWKNFVDAVGRAPGVRIHGAYGNGRLAAYLISCQEGEWLHLMYKMSRADEMVNYPNHALDYSIIQDAAASGDIRFVGNGFASITGNEGLDRYKRQMGYELAKHNVCVHLHPTLSPIAANRVTVGIVKAASSAMPKNERLSYGLKVLEGVVASRVEVAEEPSPSDDMCQQEEAPRFSRLLRPAAAFPILRLYQTLRKGGVSFAVERATDFVRRRVTKTKPKSAKTPRPLGPEEVLNLQVGELVEVKSLEEIRATLDPKNKNRGLLFTDDMRGFAGKQYRVFKRVESIFLEESKQRRTLKNTVLLEANYCPGITFRCDRSCFLFWKEAWVKRVPENVATASGTSCS